MTQGYSRNNDNQQESTNIQTFPCAICGDWNGGEYVLQMDHKDEVTTRGCKECFKEYRKFIGQLQDEQRFEWPSPWPHPSQHIRSFVLKDPEIQKYLRHKGVKF